MLGIEIRVLYFTNQQETYLHGLGTGETIGNQKLNLRITVAVQEEACTF